MASPLPRALSALVKPLVRRLRDRLLQQAARLGAVAHPTNPSGNNMSQR